MDIVHIKRLLYYRRYSFSLLELDARYKWWVMAPNTPCSLFPISHLCVHYAQMAYTHIFKTTGRIWMFCIWTTAILSESFLVWFRVAWNIRLESYDPKHASVALWYNIVCVYCKPVHTSLFGVQLNMTTKLMYLLTAYYTPNNSFTANDASFNKNQFG